VQVARASFELVAGSQRQLAVALLNLVQRGPVAQSIGQAKVVGLVEGALRKAGAGHALAPKRGVAQLAAVEMHPKQHILAGRKLHAQQLAVGKRHVLQRRGAEFGRGQGQQPRGIKAREHLVGGKMVGLAESGGFAARFHKVGA
nr:hypothetical protein [Tanacetum cinerariifolium]